LVLVVLAALGQEAPIMEFLAAVQYLAALHLRGAAVVQTQRGQPQVVAVLARVRLEPQRLEVLVLETHQALARLKATTAEAAELVGLIMVQREAAVLALLGLTAQLVLAAMVVLAQHHLFLAAALPMRVAVVVALTLVVLLGLVVLAEVVLLVLRAAAMALLAR